MHHKTIGFVGSGRITRIFIEGWQKAGKLPQSICVSDPNAEALAKLKQRFPSIETVADNKISASKDIVFVAVHPPTVPAVTEEIKGALSANAILISLAPKFTIEKLVTMLGGFTRIARVIPNAPSIIGAGFNPVCYGAGLQEQDRTEVAALLDPLGEHPTVDEPKLEAYAVLSAMGPTYFWFQIQALREVSKGLGLSDEEIALATKRMICGATRTLFESGLSEQEVIDLIPVKPLSEMEAQVTEMYRTRLPAIYQKIKP